MSELILQARNLIKTYGNTHAMRGISLDVARGESLAIMGPSGSGKSTLLHALAGIELPDSGTVSFAGRDLTTMSEAARTKLRRREFGFVFQFSQLGQNLLPEITLPCHFYSMASRKLKPTMRQING